MCNTILVNNPPTSPPGHIPQQRDNDQLTFYIYIAPPCNLDAMGSLGLAKWGGKCCYEYVGEHLQTSGSLLGSMSIAKLTSIRTVIRIPCETNGKLTALTTVQESSGCNMAETYESLLYWYQGEQSGFDANKTQTKKNIKKKKHHSSQNLLDPRNPRGPIQTCDVVRHHGGHHNERLECAEPILFVWLWYLKICWLIIIVIVPTHH